MILVKFWLHISSREQLKRFEAREEDPLKSWKLTDEDWRNRKKRRAYTRAIEDMLDETDRDNAPWTLVEADSKRYARVKVIETVIAAAEDGMRRHGLEPADRRSNAFAACGPRAAPWSSRGPRALACCLCLCGPSLAQAGRRAPRWPRAARGGRRARSTARSTTKPTSSAPPMMKSVVRPPRSLVMLSSTFVGVGVGVGAACGSGPKAPPWATRPPARAGRGRAGR